MNIFKSILPWQWWENDWACLLCFSPLDVQGNRKVEEKAKERDNRLLLTLIGWCLWYYWALSTYYHPENPFPSKQCNLSWPGCCGWLLAVQTFCFWRSSLLPPIVKTQLRCVPCTLSWTKLSLNHTFTFPSGVQPGQTCNCWCLEGCSMYRAISNLEIYNLKIL